jgi:hypothetical protein
MILNGRQVQRDDAMAKLGIADMRFMTICACRQIQNHHGDLNAYLY